MSRSKLSNRWPRLQSVACWLLTGCLAIALLAARGTPDLSQHAIRQAQESRCDGSAQRTVAVPSFTWAHACRRLQLTHRLEAGQAFDLSLLISGVGRDARIWLNGYQLRDFDPRAAFDSTSQPLLLSLPPERLQAGDNELIVQLRGGASWLDRSYLGTVVIGPSEILEPLYQRNRSLVVDGARLAVIVALAILLTVLPLALQRPQEASYRWFALAVLFALPHLWSFGWPLRPLPSVLWSKLMHASLALSLWAMLRLSLAQTAGSRRMRRWVDGGLALALLTLTVATLSRGWWPVVLADTTYRMVLLAQLLLLAAYWWRRRGDAEPLALWLAAAALLNLLLGMADSGRVWQSVSGSFAPYLLHWGILYLLILLLISRLRSILQALHTAENAQRRLTEALDQRSRELQQEFALRQQAEQARTLAEERQRIMRDMHDGVGGQLVALIGQAEHGRLDGQHLQGHLRRSLDDLRLMIDSLDDACADLGVALGMLRQRLQASLRNLPVQVSWHTAQLPDLAPRPPDDVLQVLRIVQEAITNALRHAKCRQIDVAASWADGTLSIEVRDDGQGLSGGGREGRGLPGMRLRAERIGGRIAWLPAEPGTCVRLSLPQALAAVSDAH